MVVTLVILALSAVFFVSGKIRSDVIALCALVLLLLFHILTPDEALSGFSNSVVIMMIGLFVVGGAIFQTGLAKMISGKILQLAGKSETRLFILVMLVLLDTLGLLNFCPAVFGVILACFLRYHFFYILPMYWLCRLGRFLIRSTRR